MYTNQESQVLQNLYGWSFRRQGTGVCYADGKVGRGKYVISMRLYSENNEKSETGRIVVREGGMT